MTQTEYQKRLRCTFNVPPSTSSNFIYPSVSVSISFQLSSACYERFSDDEGYIGGAATLGSMCFTQMAPWGRSPSPDQREPQSCTYSIGIRGCCRRFFMTFVWWILFIFEIFQIEEIPVSSHFECLGLTPQVITLTEGHTSTARWWSSARWRPPARGRSQTTGRWSPGIQEAHRSKRRRQMAMGRKYRVPNKLVLIMGQRKNRSKPVVFRGFLFDPKPNNANSTEKDFHHKQIWAASSRHVGFHDFGQGSSSTNYGQGNSQALLHPQGHHCEGAISAAQYLFNIIRIWVKTIFLGVFFGMSKLASQRFLDLLSSCDFSEC